MTRYEAPGKLEANLPRRLKFAQDALNQYQSSTTDTTNGPGVVINGPVTVQADNPQSFVRSIERLPASQNYNSAIR